MAEKFITKNEQKAVAELLWLYYYNQVLYEKGLITEAERNHMKALISSRKPSTLRENKVGYT